MFFRTPNHVSPYVKEIWYWKEVDPETLPWILPSYEMELVFHFSTPPTVNTLSGDSIQLPTLHWVGPQNRRWKIISDDKLNLISVRFHAGAHYEIFKIPTIQIVNSFPQISFTTNSMNLEKKTRELGVQILSLDKISQYDAIINEFLSQYKNTETQIDANIKFAFMELTNSKASISEIEKKTGISRKQIERGMKKVYGFTPGDIRKIHRILSLIRNPLNYKSENTDTRLTDIAHEFGYADQSHLIHDFKSVTGYLPKEWFKNFQKMSYFYNS